MAITEKTRLEMEAGVRANMTHAGKKPRPHNVAMRLENAMLRQERLAQIQAWQREGRIAVSAVMELAVASGLTPVQRIAVKVGDLQFTDPVAKTYGEWPSELLLANVALALEAGQDRK